MSPQHAFVAILTAALFAFAATTLAQSTPSPAIRFLDTIPAKEVSATYAVLPGSDVVLPFTVERGGKLELFLSPFRSEHGEAVSIDPSIDGLTDRPLKAGRAVFTAADGTILNLRLKVPALSQPGTYSGTLSVLLDGKHQQTDRLVLTRALVQRPAKITVDWKSPTVHEQSLSLATVFGVAVPRTFTLQVRNTSDEWRADGIFLRLLDVTAPAGSNFDAARNLRLTWNGEDVDDLWRSPAASSTTRSIAPNQQAQIGGRLRDLAPGEYTITLGLGAANATVESEQQPITLKLFVRHGLGLPLVVLVLAILLSYVATKGLEAQRRRGAALKKIDDIRKGFRMQDRYVMPAVAARAFLKQAEARNETLFDALFGQDTTSALIGKAELLCKTLERVERLRGSIASAQWTTMMRHRASKRLNALTASLNPERTDDKEATRVETEVAELEKWLDPKQVDALYLADFKGDLSTLMAQATPDVFRSHRGHVEALRNEIQQATATPVALDKVERAYGRLKILWERNRDRDYDTLEELGKLLTRNPNITSEAFFDAADALAWAQLESAKVQFVAPAVNEVEALHAYELIRFQIAPEDSKLGNNFLFKHRITYRWALYLNDGAGPRRLTQETTTEPRVVQYAPKPGTLSATVELTYDGRSAKHRAELPSVPIRKSSDYGWRSVFRLTDVTALLIAALFASITGLATYYFGKYAFGSISDYVALFVWGAGVDQTKNFLQQLGKTSGSG